MTVDTRLAAYLLWGVGTLAVYSLVLLRRRKGYKLHHDARARRDLAESIAEFLVSLAAFLAITFILFGEAGTGIRGLLSAVALGAYFAAGVLKVAEPQAPER